MSKLSGSGKLRSNSSIPEFLLMVYNYAENEPVAHIDLWGLQKVRAQWAKNIQQGAENTADFLFNRDNQTRQNLRVSWQNFRSEARATIDGLMSKLPDESRPNAKEYHDSGSRIKGPGITILSNDPHMVFWASTRLDFYNYLVDDQAIYTKVYDYNSDTVQVSEGFIPIIKFEL